MNEPPETQPAATVAQIAGHMSALVLGGIAPDRVLGLMMSERDATGATPVPRAEAGIDSRSSAGRPRHAKHSEEPPCPSENDTAGAVIAASATALVQRQRGIRRLMRRAARDDTVAELARISGLVDSGLPVADALREGRGPEWRVLSATWTLAVTSGAPLGAALARIALALTALEQLRARRSVILAGPRATMLTVASLPIVALLLGASLGFDPVPVLVTPMGAALMALGALLLGAGVLWAHSMQRRIACTDRIAGLECELVWVALKGGVDPRRARVMAVDAVDQAGAEWIAFQSFCDGSALGRTVRAAEASGVPLATMLLEEAKALRARAHTELERDAERLGVRILVPLATCVLPSFVLVGVVPVILAMLGQ